MIIYYMTVHHVYIILLYIIILSFSDHNESNQIVASNTYQIQE